jgi:hypothetical protein
VLLPLWSNALAGEALVVSLAGGSPGRLPAASVAPRAVRRPPAVIPPRSRLNPRREYVMPKERMRVSKRASSMIAPWYEARVRCCLTIEGGGNTK